jgi:hypothetical protein
MVTDPTTHLIETVRDAMPLIWLAWLFGCCCGLWFSTKIVERRQ